MPNLQQLFDGMSIQWQKERANTQMTLGEIIKVLEGMPETMKIKGLGRPHSYRGYYDDLAFEPDNDVRTVSHILETCHSVMGRVFQGYKGGNFLMGETTPVWLAYYGETGKKIIAIHKNGTIETTDDDWGGSNP